MFAKFVTGIGHCFNGVAMLHIVLRLAPPGLGRTVGHPHKLHERLLRLMFWHR
jgi:hypothetical protein